MVYLTWIQRVSGEDSLHPSMAGDFGGGIRGLIPTVLARTIYFLLSPHQNVIKAHPKNQI